MKTLLLFLVLSLNAHAGRLVGNGGEGVRESGTLYLRDFHEYGVHLSPWAGEERNPAIREALGPWNDLGLSEKQRDLLLRKLSDAERLVPRLGFSIAQAIRFFGWRLTMGKLSLLPELFPVKHYEDGNRCQIALRYLNTIQVQTKEFALLDNTGKVGLILHEAIYSMAKIVPVPDKNPEGLDYNSSQNLGATRSIVAMLFSAPGSGSPALLSRLALEGLAISEGHYPLSLGAKLALSLQQPGGKLERQLPNALDQKARKAFVQEFCAWLPKGALDYSIDIAAHRPSFLLNWAQEYSQNGMQVVLSFVDANPEQTFHLEIKGGLLEKLTSPFDCAQDLERGLASWYWGNAYISWWH